MNLAKNIERIFKKYLPSPFTIAVLLTFTAFTLAVLFTKNPSTSTTAYSLKLLSYWESGLWNASLLVFAFQMMLMLVLGHTLALSKPIDGVITWMTNYCNTTAKAAFWVCLLTLLVSLFNWGLGLIFGAIFARKVAENAETNSWKIHYPIIGASAYSGLMVWHGGISGSAPIKAAEPGHLKTLMSGIYSKQELDLLPEQLSFSETVFSSMNLSVTLALLTLLPLFMYYLGNKTEPKKYRLSKKTNVLNSIKAEGAEKLDESRIIAYVFAGVILAFAFYKAVVLPENGNLNFISPNFINFTLLGLGVLMHGHFNSFLKALNKAIGGASGILIQFPLYFGIMGLMKHSGMITQMSDYFVSISNETSFPLLTFLSAGIVNIFIPSGGGQWAIQGPIIIEASQQLGISLAKNIMALAYGDQLTNMLQPFWALPLLGITGLKAKEILPYTLLLMCLGGVIFISGLLIFS
tara:strand:- start:620 stop:2011 length:1392 start_codon:yes stop_codon:yes gene_type:complete